MIRTLLIGSAACILLLGGCAPTADNETPPSPAEAIARVKDNPNMPPEAKAAAQARIEAMSGMHQAMGQGGKK